jgi:uncharacterized protein YkwD
MWIRGCVCVLALALGLCASQAQTLTSWQDEWLARFNRERTRAGTPPLRFSPVLAQVAQEQAEEMARDGRRFERPSAGAVSTGLLRAGYSAHDWREEAMADTVRSTLRSRAALEGRFRDLGVGAAVRKSDGVRLYVFLFGEHQGDYFAGATAGLGDPARLAAEMLARVNDVRRRLGLPAMRRSLLLDRLSQEHAEDMLARSYSGHRTPEGLGPSDRAWAGGYGTGIGENIVEQRYSVAAALDAWLDSRDHRRNLLDPGCREMGLGVALGGGYDAAPGGYRVVWVQSVGRGEGLSRGKVGAASRKSLQEHRIS